MRTESSRPTRWKLHRERGGSPQRSETSCRGRPVRWLCLRPPHGTELTHEDKRPWKQGGEGLKTHFGQIDNASEDITAKHTKLLFLGRHHYTDCRVHFIMAKYTERNVPFYPLLSAQFGGIRYILLWCSCHLHHPEPEPCTRHPPLPPPPGPGLLSDSMNLTAPSTSRDRDRTALATPACDSFHSAQRS